MSDDRITELEIQFAHQEMVIDELNKIVTKQQTELNNLTHYLKLLKLKFEAFDSSPKNAQESPPPHY